MIVIINGSVGVGKTEVSWALQERFDKSVMLDGDYIGAVHPFQIYDEKRIDYLYQTITHLIRFHMTNGYHNFVINYVFEDACQLKSLVDLLQPIDQDIHSFWLTCSASEQEKRILGRDNNQHAWELKRFKELNRILEKSAGNGNIGLRIDTTGLSINKITEEIWLNLPVS